MIKENKNINFMVAKKEETEYREAYRNFINVLTEILLKYRSEEPENKEVA